MTKRAPKWPRAYAQNIEHGDVFEIARGDFNPMTIGSGFDFRRWHVWVEFRASMMFGVRGFELSCGRPACAVRRSALVAVEPLSVEADAQP